MRRVLILAGSVDASSGDSSSGESNICLNLSNKLKNIECVIDRYLFVI